MLIDANDSILVVIDVQEAFLDKLTPKQAADLLERACWLINVAKWLAIPLLITAEDIADLGTVHPDIQSCLSNEMIHDKLVFGLTGQADMLDALNQTKRKTCILIGLETDVCVAQSALGLLQLGYQVIVVADATGSPNTAHKAGLKRLENAGATLINTKGLYYEWIRTVKKAKRFKLERPNLAHPDSF